MKDNAFNQLLTLLPQEPGRYLFVVDENCSANDIDELSSRISERGDGRLLTNRFDLNSHAVSKGLPCSFSDFDFSEFADGSIDNLFFRISKERTVAHYVINQASRVLCDKGQLHLAGAKQEGIKSYIKNADLLLGDAAQAQKNGNSYSASISKNTSKTTAQQTLLNDKQYAVIREIAAIDGKPVFSKPGLFGWQKIDQGSALLAEQLPAFFAAFSTAPSVLDLGCGYGYLSIMAAKYGAGELLATDNNAAAVRCCEKNFAQRNVNGQVLADDCAVGIGSLFDAVLCHPPFHQGFDVSDRLGERFVAAASTHLKPGGKALFVANSFVPLEAWGEAVFPQVQVLVNNRQFKVVAMTRGNQGLNQRP